MKLTIDWKLCMGAGCCLEAAPRAFSLVPGPDGPRAILVRPEDDQALRRAAAACPTLAICLEDGAGGRYPQDLLGG